MKISWRWLSEYVDLTGIDPVATAELFTLSVAELEGVEELGKGLDAVVAGRLVSVEQHPDADRLKVVRVDTGKGETVSVSGAPNLNEGAMALFAPSGVTLPNGMKLKPAKMRGVASEGMLLAEDELGLTDDHTGIIELPDDVAPGTPIYDLLPVEDALWEIDNKSITHRPDLWGHYGIAREVAALVGRKLKPLDLSISFTDDDPLRVELEAPDLCYRYTAYLLRDIKIGPSPLWLRSLLFRLGVRPISNIVDATNYVMLATGNPIHAFDARFLAGDAIIVRRAREGEALTTLDGLDRKLITEDLLIADAEKGVALAGVMGGENSEIQDDTTDVVLESACFNGSAIRRTSARVKHRTEASQRFEKSLDPCQAYDAACMFGKLCLSLCPDATVASRLYDVGIESFDSVTVRTPLGLMEKKLGKKLETEYILDVLSNLGFKNRLEDGVLVSDVPTWRATKDISIPEDIVEEVGRIYGYGNIEPKSPLVEVKPPVRLPSKQQDYAIKHFLASEAKLSEILLHGFENVHTLEALGIPSDGHVRVQNPINADTPLLRRTLAPGMLASIETNYRDREAYGTFEIARAFTSDPEADIPRQPRHLCVLLVHRERRDDPDAALFYKIKGIVTSLLAWLGYDQVELPQLDALGPWNHPTRSAQVLVGQTPVGAMGEVHPGVLQSLKLPVAAALAEIDLDELLAAKATPITYVPAPKYPGITWDISVVVPEPVRVEQIEDVIRRGGKKLVRGVDFVAVYRGDPIPTDRKSVTFSILFRSDERTLLEDEIEPIHARIVESLKRQVDGELR